MNNNFNRGFIFNVMYKEIKENYIIFIDSDIIFENINCVRNVIQYMKKILLMWQIHVMKQ